MEELSEQGYKTAVMYFEKLFQDSQTVFQQDIFLATKNDMASYIVDGLAALETKMTNRIEPFMT